jgi:hypothetical protein
VWEVKVEAINESPNYETLTIDELFSKLRSTEIDNKSRAKLESPFNPTMALFSSLNESFANSSHLCFALSSLYQSSRWRCMVLGDKELALVTNKFKHLHA